MSSALFVVVADVLYAMMFDEAIIQSRCSTAHQTMYSIDTYLP
jgi:hypothetical protein